MDQVLVNAASMPASSGPSVFGQKSSYHLDWFVVCREVSHTSRPEAFELE